MKPTAAQHPPCTRCSDPTPLAIGMVAGKQTPLCGPCTLAWYQQRDKVVVAAFEKFVAKK